MNEIREGYYNAIKNKLFGLLCEYEKDMDREVKNEEWVKFLDSIIIELMGIEEEEKTINYYKLLYKINSLRYLSYPYFRRTIFDSMSLLGKMK
jgi:CRISPR/Cas system CSM-associated protein Csm2 small subunit